MPWGIDPARMLVQHRDSKTSVWYMPEDRSRGSAMVAHSRRCPWQLPPIRAT